MADLSLVKKFLDGFDKTSKIHQRVLEMLINSCGEDKELFDTLNSLKTEEKAEMGQNVEEKATFNDSALKTNIQIPANEIPLNLEVDLHNSEKRGIDGSNNPKKSVRKIVNII